MQYKPHHTKSILKKLEPTEISQAMKQRTNQPKWEPKNRASCMSLPPHWSPNTKLALNPPPNLHQHRRKNTEMPSYHMQQIHFQTSTNGQTPWISTPNGPTSLGMPLGTQMPKSPVPLKFDMEGTLATNAKYKFLKKTYHPSAIYARPAKMTTASTYNLVAKTKT